MADAKRRKRHGVAEPSPAPGQPPASRVEDRHGLWVVVSGRMKQYGDYVIERPNQVIRQQHLKNDDLLLKHNYVRPLSETEEMEQCGACGLVFLGSITSGAYRAHLGFARHDLAQTDLDTGLSRPDGRPHRVGDESNPDADNAGDWDLEPDGAPGPAKLEEELPQGARVSMGSQ